MRHTAYLASDLGFTEVGRLYMRERYVPALAPYVDVVNPWDLTTEAEVAAAAARNELGAMNHLIGQRNQQAIDRSEILIALLDG